MAPDWLDRGLYPFTERILELSAGGLHYLDEGRGPPLLLVHGTPTWSFLWRDLILRLASDHRVVAADNLGFGLSEAPLPADFGYRPQDHAATLERLVETLALEDLTLVVHDFGGPIGLPLAIRNPGRIRRLILLNTFLWPLEGPAIRLSGRLFAGPVGRWLYTGMNFSPRVMMPLAMGGGRLRPEIHRHYLKALGNPRKRYGSWALARELAGGNDHYAAMWAQREVLAGIPALLVWGLRDPAFGKDALRRWQQALPQAESVTFPEAGHFLQEQVGPALAEAVRSFLARS